VPHGVLSYKFLFTIETCMGIGSRSFHPCSSVLTSIEGYFRIRNGAGKSEDMISSERKCGRPNPSENGAAASTATRQFYRLKIRFLRATLVNSYADAILKKRAAASLQVFRRQNCGVVIRHRGLPCRRLPPPLYRTATYPMDHTPGGKTKLGR
jgi:hypothetical protein